MNRHVRAIATIAIVVAGCAACTAQAGPLDGQVICIDPGHPSENGRGTTGSRVTELHANWAVAVKLRATLQAAGATVVMTKSAEDETVSNRRRAEIANTAAAAVMVRLHCDAATGSGFALYYPDRQATVRGVTGPSRHVIAESTRIAKAMYPTMTNSLEGKLAGRGLHTDRATNIGAKQGALTGSLYSEVPVVLIEMVNLKNGDDDLFIAHETGQAAVAEALTAGIVAGLGDDWSAKTAGQLTGSAEPSGPPAQSSGPFPDARRQLSPQTGSHTASTSGEAPDAAQRASVPQPTTTPNRQPVTEAPSPPSPGVGSYIPAAACLACGAGLIVYVLTALALRRK